MASIGELADTLNVRSLSQLKNEFKGIDTFFLEGAEMKGKLPYSSLHRSNSFPTLKDSKHGKPKTGTSALTDTKKSNGTNYPSKKPKLEWIHGYRGNSPGSNLLLVSTGEVLYTSGAVVILYDRYEDRQRHYVKHTEDVLSHGYRGNYPGSHLLLVSTGEVLYTSGAVVILYDRYEDRQKHYVKHTEDVLSVCVHPSFKIAASGQGRGNSEYSEAEIHVWNVETLDTIIIVGRNQLEGNVVSIDISRDDFLMMSVEVGAEEALTLWDWESDAVLGRAETNGDNITGCAFHPYESNLMMTFGMHHLAFWKRGKDGFLERKDALAKGHSGRTIGSWAYFPEGSFVVGDSSGYITLWSRTEDDMYYVAKEIKAHDRDVNALLLLPGGTLLSGGYGDRDGQLRAWDTEDRLSQLATTTMPEGFGGVKALCPQRFNSSDGNLFIGTTHNSILEGSVHRKFRIIVQGHRKKVLDMAVYPNELAFVTVDRDHRIYKWTLRSLLWDSKLENEPLSVAVYPKGSVVAAGGANGKFVIMNAENGLTVSTIAVSDQPLTVLSYSSDGGMLAVGCQNGFIYLYHTQNQGYLYKKASVLEGENPILHIDWSLDHSALQSVISDNEFYELTIWNVINGRRLNTVSSQGMEWHDHTCTIGHNIIGIWKSVPSQNVVYMSCHKSRSGKYLSAGDKDGFIRLFKYPCHASEEVKYYERKQSTKPITSIRFLSDNYLLSSAGKDGTIFIWKLA